VVIDKQGPHAVRPIFSLRHRELVGFHGDSKTTNELSSTTDYTTARYPAILSTVDVDDTLVWIIGGWYWQGKTDVLEEKSIPVPLCPPENSHGITWNENRNFAVRGRRLTAWATVPLVTRLILIYRVIKKSLCTWWIQYKTHAKLFSTFSVTCHDNVVRIRLNRWR
jgi:hypothetical protein